MEILTLPIKKWKEGNTCSDLSDYIPHFFLNVFFALWWGRFAEFIKNEKNRFLELLPIKNITDHMSTGQHSKH